MRKSKKIIFPLGLFPTILFYIQNAERMKTELLHKYFRGETTEKEESQIVEWTESSAENKERFLKERMLFDITLFSDDSKIQRKPKGHLYLYPLIAIAAMLAIVFVMDLPHMHKPKQQLSQTIRIPAGQRAQMDLPDGSVVWLNSQTTLTYDEDFGKKDRKVTLDGEAYFEVAHNKEIPFYVQTENIKVQVTGTKFDVCSYKGSNSFIARLIEGSINLLTNSAKEEKTITRLTKGKYFSMENGKYRTGEMSSNNALAWMQGIYYFDDVPFKELLDKIALYYNYKITVKNPKILENYRCTGKFKDLDGIEHILKVIQKDHPFKYDIDNEHNKITIE